MARPKKEATAEDKTVNINFKNYMSMINFLANQLQTQKENANRQVTIASSHLSNAERLLDMLKNHTNVVVVGNDVKLDSLADEYGHIHRLLTANNVEETGTQGLADAPPPAEVKPIKPKKQRKERDPNAPKRPLTAFFLYLADKRDSTTEELKTADPEAFKPGDVQKKNTERWNALPEHLQLPYKQKYETNMEKYKKELEAYKATVGDAAHIEDAHEDEAAEAAAVADPQAAEPEEETPKSQDVYEEDEEVANDLSKLREIEESEESEQEESEEDSPPPKREATPKKESKKSTAKQAKEAKPEKKKKDTTKEEKKSKKTKEPSKSASPEAPKRKRKADDKEATKPEKKKKPRKSAGYNGNNEDY